MKTYGTYLDENPEKRKRNCAQLTVLRVSLEQGSCIVAIFAMTDTGVERVCFVDKDWATSRGFVLRPMIRSLSLVNFNGEGDESAIVTHFIVATLGTHNTLRKNLSCLLPGRRNTTSSWECPG